MRRVGKLQFGHAGDGTLSFSVDYSTAVEEVILSLDWGQLSTTLWLEEREARALGKLLVAAFVTPRKHPRHGGYRPCATRGCMLRARRPEMHCSRCRRRVARAVERGVDKLRESRPIDGGSLSLPAGKRRKRGGGK